MLCTPLAGDAGYFATMLGMLSITVMVHQLFKHIALYQMGLNAQIIHYALDKTL